jgi:hypothetical protein
MAEGSFRYRLEPAYTIIKMFGGVRAMAKIMEVSPEAVSQWNRPPIKGGYGGFIPLRFWRPIRLYARENGLVIHMKLLYTGRRKFLSKAAASKIKGDRFEFQCVNELKAAGFDAHRVPLSGAVAGYAGDVKLKAADGKDWILQCKISKRAAGRAGVAKMLGEVSIGRVVTQYGCYVAMRRDIFFRLLRGEEIKVINWPEIKAAGTMIAHDIKGHDALVFRRDKTTMWYVLISEWRYRG